MEFRILGPLEVSSDAGDVPLGGVQKRAVLAILLLHANEAVSVDRLVDELWPESPPKTAEKTVRVYVSQLRNALDDGRLERHGRGYMLRLNSDDLDAARFEALLTEGRKLLAAGEPDQAAATLANALALWRGPPLADFVYEPFAQTAIARLEERRLVCLEERIEADLALARHEDVIAELEALVRDHPLRESLRGQLMLALYRSGRQAEALEVYRDGRRLLVDELGIEPGEELRGLERAILEQDASLAGPAAHERASGVPSGTVTFLFTDIEGSTRLVQELREEYGQLLEQHHRLVRAALAEQGGEEVDTQGDAFFFAFRRARDAVRAAVEAQRLIAEADWPRGAAVRIRIGVHTGEPGLAETGYHGLDVVRAARISGSAHGGQILVSSATHDLVGSALEDVSFRDLGEHRLKDLEQPQRILQVLAPGLQEEFPPPRTADAARVMTIGGREEELAEAAQAALGAAPRRQRRAWLLVGAGALVLAAALAVTLVEVVGSDEAKVTSIAANAVGVVDPDTNRLVAQIPVERKPSAIATGLGFVWVVNTDDQIVSKIDPETSTVVDSIPVGGGPAGVAVSEGAVWVANGLDGTVSKIDPKTNTEVDKITVGSGPSGVAYGQGAVWVTNSADGTVTRIDPATDRKAWTRPAIVGASGIAVSFDRVWIVSPPSGSVVALDPRSGQVLQRIGVGVDPNAVAVGAGAVWVANRADGTVTKIAPHPQTGVAAVKDTISVGRGPVGIAAGPEGVWVANEADRTLVRLDPKSGDILKTVRLGNPARGVAVIPQGVYVVVGSTGSEHRGGVLRVSVADFDSIDPALAYLQGSSLSVLTMTNDGLVGFRRVGGVQGTQLVPDLAAELPTPADGGKSYTFRVRQGIRYSSGKLVQPDDFQRALERVFELESPGASYYSGIEGADRCTNGRSCDLSRGIVTDRAARTVRFRLTAPDADFLAKLALTFAFAVPAGTPARDVGIHPVPATGPYKIAQYRPKAKTLRVVRNRRYRQWSADAQPQGYPDAISWSWAAAAPAQVRAVERGAADFALVEDLPKAEQDALAVCCRSQLHTSSSLSTAYFFLNTRVPPFDDLRVRQAVNQAFDRGAFTRQLGGVPTCQILPPNIAGYRRTCPYLQGGASAIDTARQLVRNSGTTGARVIVWAPRPVAEEGSYMVTVLGSLGFRASLKTLPGYGPYFDKVYDPRVRAQSGWAAWSADLPLPVGFIPPLFRCASPQNLGHFCNRSIDAQMGRAQQAQDPWSATLLWQRIEREILAQPSVVPAYNPLSVSFLSKRLGNYQYNPQWGALLDQLWVR